MGWVACLRSLELFDVWQFDKLILMFLIRGFNSTLDAMARGVQTSADAKKVEVFYDECYAKDPQQMQANATQLSIRVR